MNKTLLFSVVLFFLLCYLFSCNLNIIEGQDNMDTNNCIPDFKDLLISEYLQPLNLRENIGDDLLKFVDLFCLKNPIIEYLRTINSLDNKNDISEMFLKQEFDRGIHPIITNILDNQSPLDLFETIIRGIDVESGGEDCEENAAAVTVNRLGVATIGTGIITTQCMEYSNLKGFIEELLLFYKAITISLFSLFSLYIGYNNLQISNTDFISAYDSMVFRYQFNLDNPITYQFINDVNEGNDEIEINYKELTEDIFNYYDQKELEEPESTNLSFNNVISLLKNLTSVSNNQELLDEIMENPPNNRNNDSNEIIERNNKVSSNSINRAPTKSVNNCSHLINTVDILDGSGTYDIANLDSVEQQIEECLMEEGINIDLSRKNNNISFDETVNTDTLSEQGPINTDTLSEQGPIHTVNKHPKNLTNTNMANLKAPARVGNGQVLIPEDIKDGPCLQRLPDEVKESMGADEIKNLSISRCMDICKNNENCNYIWVYTSGPEAGRCCPKESIDLSQGYVNLQDGEFIEIV